MSRPCAAWRWPPSTQHLTTAIDLGKYLDPLDRGAWSPGPFGQVVDYGRIEVATDDLGVEQATMVALRQFRSMVTAGWPVGVAGGEPMKVALTLVDAGYMTDVVYDFCRETGNRFLPSAGRGASQQHQQHYNRQTQTGPIVKHLGEGFHINWLPTAQPHLVEIDADHWKTWVHQRFTALKSNPGSITLFQATPSEHLAFAKHLTAEVKTEEFISGAGMVVKWERLRKQNHWFDSLSYAPVAGHCCGVRLVVEIRPEPKPKPRQEAKPQREPYIGMERWRENQSRICCISVFTCVFHSASAQWEVEGL